MTQPAEIPAPKTAEQAAVEKTLLLSCEDRLPLLDYIVGSRWPDPFTALVEADEWYKANIEGKP